VDAGWERAIKRGEAGILGCAKVDVDDDEFYAVGGIAALKDQLGVPVGPRARADEANGKRTRHLEDFPIQAGRKITGPQPTLIESSASSARGDDYG